MNNEKNLIKNTEFIKFIVFVLIIIGVLVWVFLSNPDILKEISEQESTIKYNDNLNISDNYDVLFSIESNDELINYHIIKYDKNNIAIRNESSKNNYILFNGDYYQLLGNEINNENLQITNYENIFDKYVTNLIDIESLKYFLNNNDALSNNENNNLNELTFKECDLINYYNVTNSKYKKCDNSKIFTIEIRNDSDEINIKTDLTSYYNLINNSAVDSLIYKWTFTNVDSTKTKDFDILFTDNASQLSSGLINN